MSTVDGIILILMSILYFCQKHIIFRQKSGDTNDFENEPLFAPITNNEVMSDAQISNSKEAEKVEEGFGGISISGENMLARGKEIEAIIANNYVESVMKIQVADFVDPQDVANPAGGIRT